MFIKKDTGKSTKMTKADLAKAKTQTFKSSSTKSTATKSKMPSELLERFKSKAGESKVKAKPVSAGEVSAKKKRVSDGSRPYGTRPTESEMKAGKKKSDKNRISLPVSTPKTKKRSKRIAKIRDKNPGLSRTETEAKLAAQKKRRAARKGKVIDTKSATPRSGPGVSKTTASPQHSCTRDVSRIRIMRKKA